MLSTLTLVMHIIPSLAGVEYQNMEKNGLYMYKREIRKFMVSDLKIGMKGEIIKKLHKWLKKWGFYDGDLDVKFGPSTEESVKLFQEKAEIGVDGLVGIQTKEAMDEWEKHNSSVSDISSSINESTSSKYGESSYSCGGYCGRYYGSGKGLADDWVKLRRWERIR